MQLLKARKNAKKVAVASILFGALILFVSIFFYFKFIRHFEVAFSNVTKDQNAQAIILDLVAGSKDIVVTILPTCGIIMIATGYYMLRYLRKEREESESQSGRS